MSVTDISQRKKFYSLIEKERMLGEGLSLECIKSEAGAISLIFLSRYYDFLFFLGSS